MVKVYTEKDINPKVCELSCEVWLPIFWSVSVWHTYMARQTLLSLPYTWIAWGDDMYDLYITAASNKFRYKQLSW